MVLRDRTRLVVGSVGLAIALTGLLIFLGQMYRAIETGHLESVVVRHVIEEPIVRRNVPSRLSESLRHISGTLGADTAIDWLLDEFPLPLLLIVVGGAAAWRSLAWGPPASHRH
jgi:hypothetical protein